MLLVTVVAFCRVPVNAGSTVPLMAISMPPVLSAPMVQLSTFPDNEHGPRELVPLAPVMPAGRVSVTTTAWASDGPALLARTVQAICCPATALAGPVLLIERSAEVWTGVLVLVWLSVLSGSGVVALTDTELVIDGATTPGATTAATSMVALPAEAMVGSGQVAVVVPSGLAWIVHAGAPPPATAAAIPVSPAGRTSVTTAP